MKNGEKSLLGKTAVSTLRPQPRKLIDFYWLGAKPIYVSDMIKKSVA